MFVALKHATTKYVKSALRLRDGAAYVKRYFVVIATLNFLLAAWAARVTTDIIAIRDGNNAHVVKTAARRVPR